MNLTAQQAQANQISARFNLFYNMMNLRKAAWEKLGKDKKNGHQKKLDWWANTDDPIMELAKEMHEYLNDFIGVRNGDTFEPELFARKADKVKRVNNK